MKRPSAKPSGVGRRDICLGIAIFLLAFGLRLVYLHQIQQSPLFDAPIMDAKYHDDWAQDILTGTEPAQDVFFRAPGYPYFLAGIYAIFGHSYFWARLIQFLLGSLSCVMIFVIARRISNRTVAGLAGILAATYGVFIYFEGELLIPSLMVFVELLAVWAFLILMDNPKSTTSLLSGVLLGLAALARPNVLVVALAFFLWVFLFFRPTHGYRPALGYALSFALGILLAIAPVTVRNYVQGQDLVLISSQGGVNFCIGNNRDSDGVWAGLHEIGTTWESVYEGAADFAEQSAGRTLKASEISRFWTRRGFDFIRSDPVAALRLGWRKLLHFWNGQELPNNKDLYFFSASAGLLRLLLWKRIVFFPFGILGPLSLVGMGLLWRHNRKAAPLALFVLAYMLSVIPFFVNSRFRVPVLPFLIIFASYALYWLLRRNRQRRLSTLVVPAALLLLLGVFANRPMYAASDPGYSLSHNKLGVAHLEKGNLFEAVEQFETALQLKPDNNVARINLSSAFMTMGRYDQAIAALRAGLASGAEQDRLHYNLGLAWHQMGKFDEASAHYQAALECNPAHVEARNNLGSLYVQLGRLAEAAREFRSAASRSPDDYQPHFNLGIVYAQQQKHAEAIEEFLICARLNGDFADAYYNLGMIWKGLGKKSEAISALTTFLNLHAARDERRAWAEASLAELAGGQ
jgi:tetratricopeptide (TPR) repeat protein